MSARSAGAVTSWSIGSAAFALDGTEQPRQVNYAYRFDAATASPSGRFAVIYETLGTKGLLLDRGRILREIDRSFYCASSYEYPVALFDVPDGRTLLAHCPRDYCRIELEDAETGCSLTSSAERKPADFFHARLAASPGGKRLLSAGWIWHPLDEVAWFDVAQALADPHHLDAGAAFPRPFNPYLVAESSACWLDDDCFAVAASAEPGQDEIEEEIEPRLHPSGLAVYDVARQTCLRTFQLDEPAGTLVGLGTRHVLSLYRHPKLIDLATGQVVHTWTDLQTGLQISSIMDADNHDRPPPMAFDRTGLRFALANGDTVTVITFDRAALAATDQ